MDIKIQLKSQLEEDELVPQVNWRTGTINRNASK